MEVMTMNDDSNTSDSSNPGSLLLGFALGAVVGAGVALLLAPSSGKRTRKRLASTARRWSSSAGQSLDEARATVTDLGSEAASALKAGKDAFLAERRTASGAASGLNAVQHSSNEAAR
jgi:gas vesicle protein